MNFKNLAVMGAVVASFMATHAVAADVTLTKRNTLVMNKEFTSDVTAQLAVKAKKLDEALAPGEVIYLVLNTPGGSIFAGLEFIENLNSLKHRVDTVTIFAASMGFQTVQQVTGNRYIVENGTLMSHKASGGIEGEFPGQLDSRYRYILSVVTEMDRKNAVRTKGKHTLESYQSLIENEYWCAPGDCLKEGFIDAKATVRCDNTLSGTYEEVVEELSMLGMNLQLLATFADCPTITSPLALRVKIDGAPEEKVKHKLSRDQKEAIHTVKRKVFERLTSKTKRVVYYNEVH